MHYIRLNVASPPTYYWSQPAQNWTSNALDATLFPTAELAREEAAYVTAAHAGGEVQVCGKGPDKAPNLSRDAFDYLDDANLAADYLAKRLPDVTQLMLEIGQKSRPGPVFGTIRVPLYPGIVLVIDPTLVLLHPDNCYADVHLGDDIYIGKTQRGVLAFILARYW